MTKSSTLSIVSALLFVVAGTVGSQLTEPDHHFHDGDRALTSMEGHWHGVPTYAVPGPMPTSSGFNFTVVSLPSGNSSSYSSNTTTASSRRWLLSDRFDGYLVHGSYQQFWVDQEAATLTYCVTVLNWLWNRPSRFSTPFIRTGSSGNNSIWWSADNQTFDATWTLTLLSPTQLHSRFVMDGALHLDIVYTRQSEVVPPPPMIRNIDGGDGDGDPRQSVGKRRAQLVPFLSEEGRDAVLGKSWGLPPVCTVTLPPATPSPAAEGDEATTPAAMTACPYGFRGNHIPQFVQHQIAAKKKKKAEAEAEEEAKQKEEVNVAANDNDDDGAGDYESCYLINPTMNLRIRWTWNNATESVDVLVSASKTAGGSSSSPQSGQYLAIGILPQWPLMRGMDVALGFVEPVYGYGCVQSLYAAMDLGTPEKNPSQVLRNTTSWTTRRNVSSSVSSNNHTEDAAVLVEETLWVRFSRPFVTGHHNLWNNLTVPAIVGPMLAFAQGPVYATPASAYEPTNGRGGSGVNFTKVCEAAVPGYHGSQRGVYGFQWRYPHQALNDYMKCDRN